MGLPILSAPSSALRAALEKQPITLIQGPPGTGKTRIVLSLLSVILHARPSHGARRGGVHATRDDADAGAAAADAKAGDGRNAERVARLHGIA